MAQKQQVEIGKKAPMIRRIASALIGLLILFYLGYQIWAANFEPIKLETANWATAADAVQAEGYAIRKETVITAEDTGGVIGYRIADGGRVAKDGVVADIFANEEAAVASQQSQQLAEEIELLESLNNAGETYAADIQQIDSRIDQIMGNLLFDVQGRSFREISDLRKELTHQFNQRQIATGTDVNYEARLSALKQEKESLEQTAKSITGQIKAPMTGNFSSMVDGWEIVFDYDKVLDMTVEDLQQELSPKTVPEDAVGKISEEFSWYFVCAVDATTALKLKQAGQVELSMPFATTEKIPAEIAAVNQKTPTDEGLVVLKCNSMDSALMNVRKETVQIEIKSYSGVMVNQKAIHFETVEQTVTDANGKKRTVTHENVKGVYVKSGGQLHFVQIFSDITVNGYAICRTEVTEEEQELLVTDKTIQLYDEVVVEGTDLYDGKVV